MRNSATLRFYFANISYNQCLETILTAEVQSAQRTTEKLLDPCARRMNPQKTAMSQILDIGQNWGRIAAQPC